MTVHRAEMTKRPNHTVRRPLDERSAGLLGVRELADLLGTNERFVRRLVAERRLPFHKVGKYVRFDPRHIESWLSEHRRRNRCLKRHDVRELRWGCSGVTVVPRVERRTPALAHPGHHADPSDAHSLTRTIGGTAASASASLPNTKRATTSTRHAARDDHGTPQNAMQPSYRRVGA